MVSRVQEMAEAANEFNNELTDHYYLWFKAGVSVVDGTADTFAAYLDYAKIACKENGPGRPACRCTCTFYEPRQREQALREQTGLDPEIEWSDTGRIQLNEEVTVTLTHEIDLGLFAGFGSFPITLRADATGKSEVYWK